MKFDVNLKSCSNMGLELKFNNKGDVVIFFDGNEESALYRINVFRCNVVAKNGFLSGEKIHKGVYVESYFDSQYDKIEESYKTSYVDTDVPVLFKNDIYFNSPGRERKCGRSAYYSGYELKYEDNLLKKDNAKTYGLIYKDKNGVEVFSIRELLKERNENIKFISSFINDRNSLYFVLDFLPFGHYIVCLESEDRSGNVIKKSIPYYFSITNDSHKQKAEALLETINSQLSSDPTGFGRYR